jgi:hypothetical protein
MSPSWVKNVEAHLPLQYGARFIPISIPAMYIELDRWIERYFLPAQERDNKER